MSLTIYLTILLATGVSGLYLVYRGKEFLSLIGLVISIFSIFMAIAIIVMTLTKLTGKDLYERKYGEKQVITEVIK